MITDFAKWYGDSPHRIVKKLEGNAELHRFRNAAGVDYSAIYVGNLEVWSRERTDEEEMLKQWPKRVKAMQRLEEMKREDGSD